MSRTQIRISFKIEGITFMAEAVRAHEIIWWGGTVKSKGRMRTLVPKRQLEGRLWEEKRNKNGEEGKGTSGRLA